VLTPSSSSPDYRLSSAGRRRPLDGGGGGGGGLAAGSGHGEQELEGAPTAPITGLAAEEGTDGAQVAFMAQEVGLLGAGRPELDGVAQRVHGLRVAPDEGAAKVNV